MAKAPRRQYLEAGELLQRIRTRCIQRGAVGIKGIGRLFRIADDNSNGTIDLINELPKLLSDIGVILNKTELAELQRIFDRDGSGTVSYDEFLFSLAPPLNETRIAWINKAFDKLDADGSGLVTIADLDATLNPATSEAVRLGKTSAAAVFKNLLSSYDSDADGKITREEFIDYYREISPSIDSDEYWIEMIKKSWRL